MPTKIPAKWTTMNEDTLENSQEYAETTQGWKQIDSGAKVLIFKPQNTGLKQETDKDWAVLHPWDSKKENHTEFFDSEAKAIEAAKEWMQNHPTPENAY